MLGDFNSVAIIPVRDLDESKKFYEEVLGFVKIDENPGGVAYKTGDNHVFVYASEFAGTNKATAVAWEVQDIEKLVASLKEKGVSFEHYPDLGGTTLQGDIHVMGPMKSAWFKDPTGNILALNELPTA